MEAPQQVQPSKLADYFEVLTKAVFQSGMSWKVVEAKWPGFRAAFHDFDPATVAGFSPDDVDRLCADPRIIRNRRKVEATVANAETMLAVDREYGGFANYLRAHGGFDATAADLKKRFKFVGDLAAYYLLYVVGEPVPPHEEWMATRGVTLERRRPPSTASLPRPRGR
ncbi:MAG: DNA-3-methyladenine glycosylase I [Chloroflexi bacterium]|nr:DNA-3-methyladenine glycosylase I [Chloroflexota bacterium]